MHMGSKEVKNMVRDWFKLVTGYKLLNLQGDYIEK
jgi:hypothetical protein